MSNIKDLPKYLFDQYQGFSKEVPSIIKTHQFIDDLITFLFPIKADKECVIQQVELNLLQLQINFKKLLEPLEKKLDKSIDDLSKKFFSQVPDIYKNLMKDASAFLGFDPAAKSIEGIIIYYPGFYAIAVYRLAHELYKLKIPFIPRMISEYAHGKTGIDMHPGAQIGDNFLIDHGTGIVIGETTVIGNNVKIYQGVTLGAVCVEKELANTKRHPTIEDNVIIYSGSSILGGNTVVGHNTIIGGNVWLTKSVEPYSLVYNESKTVIRNKNNKPPIDFVI